MVAQSSVVAQTYPALYTQTNSFEQYTSFISGLLGAREGNVFVEEKEDQANWVGGKVLVPRVSCPINISTQPLSQTDCNDNSVEFTAAFNAGGASVNYQWEISNDGGNTWNPVGAFPNISGASGSGVV